MEPQNEAELRERGTQVLVRELGHENARRFLKLIVSAPEIPLEPTAGEKALPTPPSPTPPAPATHSVTASPHTAREQQPFLPFSVPEQPWSAPPAPQRSPDEEDERNKLLASLANSQLGTIEQRVAYILMQFPETRDNDTALSIRYWMKWQSEHLAESSIENLDVLYDLQSIDTITRQRRAIQNDLGLFQGHPRTRALRAEKQAELHEYLAEKRNDDPEIRFYLDETGNNPEQRFTGIAGVCVLDWRQYERFYAALTQWRHAQGWPETIHFADMHPASMDRPIALLRELQKWRAGLLFVGHSIPSRGDARSYIFDLFVQLVIDSLHWIDRLGCLRVAKKVVVYKEAELGFDKTHLPRLKVELEQQITREFPDRAYLGAVEPMPKGRCVLLECADLIAASMQRRALFGSRTFRDQFAEAVMNVTGFEDSADLGVVHKAYLA